MSTFEVVECIRCRAPAPPGTLRNPPERRGRCLDCLGRTPGSRTRTLDRPCDTSKLRVRLCAWMRARRPDGSMGWLRFDRDTRIPPGPLAERLAVWLAQGPFRLGGESRGSERAAADALKRLERRLAGRALDMAAIIDAASTLWEAEWET